MKNFPHQFADIDRLTEALNVASDTIAAGRDFSRDDVFGPDLARAYVYTFRGNASLEDNLRAEREKPRASRGTETAAREMRRFLLLSGFIKQDEVAGHFAVSPKGRELLGADSEAVRKALWREAMLDLRLSDADGNISHPYRVMLRLLSDNPGIETSKLMLAFEAIDDSEAEYERVSNYLALDFEDLIDAIGIGEAKARNAVKILPSIARQVGDLVKDGAHSFPSAAVEVAEDGVATVSAKSKKKKSAPSSGKRITKEVDGNSIAATPEFSGGQMGNNLVDLSGAIELRNRRTKLHQEVVREFAEVLTNNGYRLFEDPFDCLALKGSQGLLIEVKTLDGSPSDERRQSEKALGQIKGYVHFDLPEEVDTSALKQVILFSQKPSDATTAFLSKNGVLPIWRTEPNEFQLLDGDELIAFDIGYLFS